MRIKTLKDNLLRRAMDAELPDDETAERILGGALEQAEDFGLRRFTIDDVSRRVGLSRVTIYRYFAKKDQLIDALIMRELRRFLTDVDAVIAEQGSPEGKLTEGLIFAITQLRGHRLLNRILRTEPEILLPHLTVRADNLVASVREWIAGHIRTEVDAGHVALPDTDIDIVAELLVRIALSLVLTPTTVIPIDSPKQRQRFVDTYVNPVVHLFRPGRDPSPPA